MCLHHSLVGVPLALRSKEDYKQTRLLGPSQAALTVAWYDNSSDLSSVTFNPRMCMQIQEHFFLRLLNWARNPMLELIGSEEMIVDARDDGHGEQTLSRGPEWIIAAMG